MRMRRNIIMMVLAVLLLTPIVTQARVTEIVVTRT